MSNLYLILSAVAVSSGVFAYLGYIVGVQTEENRTHNRMNRIGTELSRKERHRR